MKNRLWGYLRPLLLGAITAAVLLWSVTAAVPAAANPQTPSSAGQESSFLRHPVRQLADYSASPAEILNNIRSFDSAQDDRREMRIGLKLSLPFVVKSQWTSVDNNTPGIVWATFMPSTDGQTNDGKIKFGIKNGQFIANATDTWFVYGWFGALSAIKQPYNVKYPEWGNRHNGIDFAGREGLDVVSASAGKVIFAGRKIGNTVIVNAGNNYQITYGHLQDISVRRGQILQIGDPIGHLGKTGTVNPHLHFQVDSIKKDSRTAINPVPLFDTEWGSIVIPTAEANQFYTENQDPLSQPDFLW